MKFKSQLNLFIFPSILIPVIFVTAVTFIVTGNRIGDMEYDLLNNNVNHILSKCEIEHNVIKALGMENVDYYREATIQQVLSDIGSTYTSNSSVTILDMQTHEIVFSSEIEKDNFIRNPDNIENIVKRKKGPQEVFLKTNQGKSVALMTVFAVYDKWNWLIICYAEKKAVFSYMYEAMTLSLSIIFLFFVISFISIYKISKRINESLDILSRGTQRIYKNDFDMKIKIKGNDEFKELAHNFNIMAEEIKNNQNELVESERMLRDSQSVAHIGSYVIDLCDRKFDKSTWKASPEFYKIFGIDKTYPHTWAGWEGLIHPFSRESIIAHYFQAVADRDLFDYEYKIIRINDGAERWVQGTGDLEYDDQKNPVKMIGTLQDITERKQAEQELRIEEDRFRKIIEKSPLPMVITDQNQNIVFLNDKFTELFGYTLKEVSTHKKWWERAYPDKIYREKVKQSWDDAIEYAEKNKKDIAVQTWSLTIKDRTKRTCEFYIVPLGEVGLVIISDISEKKKLENQIQQSQKMESIGTLAGGIAHDFNNILFPIVGHTEMLLEDVSKDSPFRASLSQIYTGAMRASELVKQILTFSRQESGELKLMKMQPIIKEALKLIRSTIPTTIEIKQDISPACGVIKADPTKIHQIVMNLSTNAYHAMEETGGELKVSLNELELSTLDLINPDMATGVYVCLTVVDTGKGMDKNVINQIFDPFFTTKEKGKGTGLGLSVIHGIVTSMNGVIQVYSEPGKGTVFNVYLPVEKSPFAEQISDSNVKTQIGTEKILLVDDEETIISMEKLMLERLGYHVTSRTSSIEALEAFRAAPDKFDLVITDMAMPNMPGNKLSAELIKIRPDIPVLLCTGFSETMSEEKAASIGIKGFLWKPIVMKDLSQKIREVLDK